MGRLGGVALLALLSVWGCGRSDRRAPARVQDGAASRPPAAPPRVLWQRESPFGKVFVVLQDGLRILRFGGVGREDQSAYDPARPLAEPLEYVRTALLGFAYIHKPRRVLMVGLGGGSFLRHARRWAPRAVLEAVEINPVVVTACRRWFGFERAGKVSVFVEDGRRFLRRRLAGKRRYDLIFLDAYDAVDYPRHLGTLEFFGEVRRALAPGGVAVGNLSPNATSMRDSLVRTFSAALGRTACYYSPTAGNTVVVGGPGVARVTPASLSARIKVLSRHLGRRLRLEHQASERCPFGVEHAPLLRDRKAPPRGDPPRPGARPTPPGASGHK